MDTQAIGLKACGNGEVLDAHRQWASRPADEAVFTVEELLKRTAAIKASSLEVDGVPWSTLSVTAKQDDLCLSRGAGSVVFNNYSLGQFCGLPVGNESVAPHGFITQLSAKLAADVLNERIAAKIARKADATLLVQDRTLRSITSDAYARVWDHELAERIADLCQRSTWQPAEAFKRAGGQSNGRGVATSSVPALPLGWVGDRSMFVALVDYEGVIKSDGNTYARFFLLSNSEVGAGSLKITFGLMDFACCNFILWGCTDVYEANFRHTKSIHERWAALSAGLPRQLSADSQATILDGIRAARGHLLGEKPDQVVAVVQAATTLPKMLVTSAFELAQKAGRYGDPRSVWGMVNGLTEASQATTEHADKRAIIDAKAAQLMGLLKR
jgi:hypothetical protein